MRVNVNARIWMGSILLQVWKIANSISQTRNDMDMDMDMDIECHFHAR